MTGEDEQEKIPDVIEFFDIFQAVQYEYYNRYSLGLSTEDARKITATIIISRQKKAGGNSNGPRAMSRKQYDAIMKSFSANEEKIMNHLSMHGIRLPHKDELNNWVGKDSATVIYKEEKPIMTTVQASELMDLLFGKSDNYKPNQNNQ